VARSLTLRMKGFDDVARHRAPRHLAARFRTAAQLSNVEAALREHYFPRPIWGNVRLTTEQWLASEEGQRDLRDHLHRRLRVFRTQVVPWLDHAKSLAGARVLEIGCGTGASTVALAEQGAIVTAVDIDTKSLIVAAERCQAYGVQANLLEANGTALEGLVALGEFDFVIFFACLEHMTYAERIAAMRSTWNALQPGALWCAIETPNRLWIIDEHTSRLPFYNWLPDELAFDYSQFSQREPFRNSYRQRDGEQFLSFLRHGRGVSYHEFEIAMKSASTLDVVSCLHLRQRARSRWRSFRQRWTRRGRFEALIAAERRDLHRGFFLPYLDLIIRKD
jgi:2-polyprenyl-3-methyl-5-hydroxy-6-metoxy-1,4-benzoquinol methylase